MQGQNAKPGTKRDKITKANSTVFVAVAIASVVVMFSLMSFKFLWTKMGYNSRVISAKTEARDKLKENSANLDSLITEFPELNNSPTTNAKTILHALPPSYDYTALASYIEALARQSGVSFPGSVGQDASASAVKDSNISSPLEIPLSIEVNGSYDAVATFIKNTELSIRPIHITNIEYSGSNEQLKAVITAKTYYQPARNLDVGRREVQ